LEVNLIARIKKDFHLRNKQLVGLVGLLDNRAVAFEITTGFDLIG